jgi:hypothetical protein
LDINPPKGTSTQKSMTTVLILVAFLLVGSAIMGWRGAAWAELVQEPPDPGAGVPATFPSWRSPALTSGGRLLFDPPEFARVVGRLPGGGVKLGLRNRGTVILSARVGFGEKLLGEGGCPKVNLTRDVHRSELSENAQLNRRCSRINHEHLRDPQRWDTRARSIMIIRED